MPVHNHRYKMMDLEEGTLYSIDKLSFDAYSPPP